MLSFKQIIKNILKIFSIYTDPTNQEIFNRIQFYLLLLFHSVNATRGRGEMLLFEKISNNQYKEKVSI